MTQFFLAQFGRIFHFVLLQCVGASKAPVPQIVKGELRRDTTVVVCTDGLWRTIDEDEIFRALCPQMCVTQNDMLEQCRGYMTWQ